MMKSISLCCVLLLVAVSGSAHARYLHEDEVPVPRVDIDELSDIWIDHVNSDHHELAARVLESVFPGAHARQRRQVHGSGSLNPAGGMDINVATPLKQTDFGTLSAVGSVVGLGKDSASSYGSAGGGLAFNTDAGHAAAVQMNHIPNFGDQLTGAAKVNLLNTDLHNLNAGASVTRSFPNANTGLPNFNTYAGNVGYQFNDKLGATLSAARTPLFQKTDLSAMGNYNLFKDRSSSLDLSTGFSRSFSPYIPKSTWQPSVGIGFTKYW